MLNNLNILGFDYFLLMAFLWSMAFFCYCLQQYPTTINLRVKSYPVNVFLLRFVFLVLGTMAALRGLDVANDTISYYSAYHYFKSAGSLISTHMEFGYVALNLLIAKIFPEGDIGFHILVGITSLFCYFSVEQWIEKHAKTYGICFLFFYFLLNSFFISAIRQSVAISIILIALSLLERGHKFSFILGVALAACFHITALVSFCFLFFYNKKFNYKWGIVVCVTAVLISSSNLTQIIFAAITPNTVYIFGSIGNAANVLILSAFYLLILSLQVFIPKNDKNFRQKNKFSNDFFSFCIVITLAITILSVKGPILHRVSHYFTFAGLPYIANTLYSIPNRKFANFIKIILGLCLWLYSAMSLILRPEWNHLWPYHFFWN